MRRAYLVILALCLVAVAGTFGCQKSEAPPDGKVSVVASFYPLYEAAKQVGGDMASVRSLVPSGIEPHDFEPTPQDITILLKAKVLVVNGTRGFEPWLERITPDLEKNKIVIVNTSRNIDLLQMPDEEDPSAEATDPHFWLDPVLMKEVVLSIGDAYIEVDPQNTAVYNSNAAAYNANLEALHQKFLGELGGYQKRAFVTAHAAFGYLAARYNLEMIAIAGMSPIDEPSPQEMAAIVKIVRERGIKYIFFETLVSPLLAQTIAREAGASTLVLNPLEGLTDEEIQAGENYISVMEQNLANLKKALEAGR